MSLKLYLCDYAKFAALQIHINEVNLKTRENKRHMKIKGFTVYT